MRRLLRTTRIALAAGGLAIAISLASCAAPGAAVPAVPAAPVAAVPVAPIPGAPVAVPAEPQGFFARICANCEACRRKLCTTPAGAMLNQMTAPLSAMTGGIFPSFCPIVPSPADLAKPGVAGASDAIKKDALEAKMRRDKVRFLATVDCRYYPDAIGALTAALRTDGSECVRFEAALALNRGCCCNQKTIDALEASVSGTDRDGAPAERSVRVRCAAASALERCLSCYVPPPVIVEPVDPVVEPKAVPDTAPLPSEKKGSDATAAKTADANKTAANDPKKVTHPDLKAPSKQSVERAWQTLNDFYATLAAERPLAATPRADRTSVYQIVRNVIESPMPADVQVDAATSFPQPMATDPGTPIRVAQPAMTPPGLAPGRATLGQPMPEREPVAPAGPSARTPAEETPTRPTPSPAAALPPADPRPLMPGVISEAHAAPPIPPTPAPGASPLAPAINQLLHGATPAERQAAVRQIGGHDWQKNPAVASMLILGAKNDTSSIVRVECIRQIATGQMAHPQVILELEGLVKDSDQAVRSEATRALSQLKPTPNP